MAMTSDDVIAVLGPGEETVVAEVIATGNTHAEIAEACGWALLFSLVMTVSWRPGHLAASTMRASPRIVAGKVLLPAPCAKRIASKPLLVA